MNSNKCNNIDPVLKCCNKSAVIFIGIHFYISVELSWNLRSSLQNLPQQFGSWFANKSHYPIGMICKKLEWRKIKKSLCTVCSMYQTMILSTAISVWLIFCYPNFVYQIFLRQGKLKYYYTVHQYKTVENKNAIHLRMNAYEIEFVFNYWQFDSFILKGTVAQWLWESHSDLRSQAWSGMVSTWMGDFLQLLSKLFFFTLSYFFVNLSKLVY